MLREASIGRKRNGETRGCTTDRAGFSRQCLGTAVLVAGILASATDAFALWGDRLELFAAESVTHDSNVFRLSSGLNPAPLIGSSSTADTYYTSTFGLNLDLPVSRQRFQAGMTWNDYRYDRFTQLDFTGRDGHAIWLWQAGNDWSGQLGFKENLALASFLDIHGVAPDPIDRKQTFFNATYLLTPRWRLQAGVSSLAQRNGEALLNAEDIDVDSTEFTASYVTPAKNSIGLDFRVDDARFPNPQFVAGSAFDNAYTQYSAGVVLDWAVTGKSHLSAQLGRVSRNYNQLPQRDYDGTTYKAAYDWKPTGKLALSLITHRDISTVTDIQTSFALVRGTALTPTLNLTEKTSVSATLDYSVYDYRGNPALTLGLLQHEVDRVRSEILLVTYKPTRTVTVLLNAQHQARASTIPFLDFSDNLYSVAGRIAF